MRTFLFLLCLLLVGCDTPSGDQTAAPPAPSIPDDSTAVAQGPVMTGAHVLAEENFEQLRGLRVGLIVNHTARVDTTHLADLMHQAPDVEIGALFGPEHGIRGAAGAGETVAHDRDPEIGAPIYSLYGQTRKPTPEMLDGLDALVFDIQDIGARFYTYISTMGLAMQAAAEADLPFYVLDRPNPLGGDYVSGFVLESGLESFVGQYPIPIAHGLTVGELARMIQGEAMLSGLDELQLEVVEATGWERSMRWPETGLPWITPSPNIPDYETALVYPGACFFEATAASEGRGTQQPFLLLGAPWTDGERLASALSGLDLPGVTFHAASFTPRSIPGMAPTPKLEGRSLEGIRHEVTDDEAFRPVETGIYVLHTFYERALDTGENRFLARPDWLDRLAGTERLREFLTDDATPAEIIEAWEEEIEAFREQRAPYLLY